MSDCSEEEIDIDSNGDIPSPFGRYDLKITGSLASIQSKVKGVFIDKIRSHLSGLKYILTGDIMLDVTWTLSAKSRYETDGKSDIDNCLKPIIDAFTGKEGLFIDDCQLRRLSICWQHSEYEDENVLFEFEFISSEYQLKDGFVFVDIGNGICTPINRNYMRKIKKCFARSIKTSIRAKGELERIVDYQLIAYLVGGNQLFHKSRCKKFEIVSIDEYVKN